MCPVFIVDCAYMSERPPTTSTRPNVCYSDIYDYQKNVDITEQNFPADTVEAADNDQLTSLL